MAIATFNGEHNISKSKLLLILYSANKAWARHSFTAKELSCLTGLTLPAIKALVWRLYRYRYIGRRDCGYCYEYRIATRGVNFVEERIPEEVSDYLIPILNKCVKKSGVKTW
jgi:hypothetical protein